MFLLLVLLSGIFSSARAQDLDTHPARGFMPNMDQLTSPVDNIQVSDGKLYLQIPLASLPRGKGGTGFDLNLDYDSRLYDVDPYTAWVFYNDRYQQYFYKYLIPVTQSGGWTYNAKNYSIESEGKSVPFDLDEQCTQNPLYDASYVRNVRYRLTLPDGSMHILQLAGYEDYSPFGTGDGFNAMGMNGRSSECAHYHHAWPEQYVGWLTYYTNDGSYLKFEVYADGTGSYFNNWKLYYPDGRRVFNEDGIIKEYDANGNYISIANACYDPPPEGDCSRPYTTIYDASNRDITIEYNITDADLLTDTWKRDQVTAPGPNGTITYTIDWQALEIGGGGRQYFVGQYVDGTLVYLPLSARFWTVKYIQLPSPQYRPDYPVPLGDEPPIELSYEFGYWDNDDTVPGPGYGQLDQMRMPSGSPYDFHCLYDYHYLMTGFTTGYGADVIAHEIAISDKQITHDSVSDMQWTYDYDWDWTRVTNPDGGQTKYYLERDSPVWDGNLITRIEEPKGSIKKRIWDRNQPYGLRNRWFTPNNPYIAKEIVTVGNSGESPTKSAVTDFSYDKNGNLLTKTEFDWVDYPAETGVTIKRKTDFDYIVTVPDASAYPVTDDANAYWNPHNTAIWPAGTARRLNSVLRRTVSNGSTAYAATEYSYDYPYSKGNIIAEKRWDSEKSPTLPGLGQLSTSNSQVLQRAYDSYGNLTDILEPEVRTNITYDPEGNVVTRVDQGYQTSAQRSFQYTWQNDVAIGSKTDLDNNLTTSYTYDDVGRQLTMTDAGLRHTVTAYDDVNRKVTVTSDLRSYLDGKLQTITHYDQLGRVNLVQKSDGAPLSGDTDGIKLNTIYLQPSESVRSVIASTAYRNADFSDPTLEWSCTQYDQLGRVTAVAMFKGSSAPTDCGSSQNRTGIANTVYDAEWTNVTDPAGKIRKQRRDALGRMVEVVEDPNELDYDTTYAYDPLDNLSVVTQGSQTRYFSYSSLSRLGYASNPESGVVYYTYDDSGNLTTRTDARGIVTTMTYDSLHRIESKTYNDGTPAVSYDYNLAGSSSPPNIGKLESIYSDVASTTFEYGQLGNVTSSTHTISGYSGNLVFNYDWYLNDRLKSIQYPSGRLVQYNVDDAGRANTVYVPNIKTYADLTASGNNSFTPDGRIAEMRLGNNLWETRDYLPPGSPTLYKLGTTQGAWDLLKLEYHFSQDENNGNVMQQVIQRPSKTWIQNYLYDGVNRLLNASEVDGFDRTYGYDQYGNRRIEISTGLAYVDSLEPTLQSDFDSLNNWLIKGGTTYDAAGNQEIFSPFTLGYDAEGRNTTITSASDGNGSFAYDGEGRRVKKVWTPPTGPATTTYYVYDALGQLAAEYSSEVSESAGTSYPFSDMLGSVRAVTSESGTVEECYDYLPFGRMLSSLDNGRSGSNCYPLNPDTQIDSSLPQKFTGKERDAETGLDYFGARYFSSPQGRFTSPDPLLNSGRPDNPQSWNRYAYTLNNPLRYVDPNGLYEWAASGCSAGDRDCEKEYKKYQKQFRDSLTYLKMSRDSFDKKSNEYKRIDAALKMYGKEGEKGVSVGFGALAGAAEGETTPQLGKLSFSVTLDPSKWGSGADATKLLASTVGHEGTHVSDMWQVFAGNGSLSDFSLEYRAYQTSAFVFQGLFTPATSASSGASFGGVAARTLSYGGSLIWNTSWSAADKAAIQSRDTGITNAVKSIYGHTETTPHNPWGN
jgi:RHS repeat-associated protein